MPRRYSPPVSVRSASTMRPATPRTQPAWRLGLPPISSTFTAHSRSPPVGLLAPIASSTRSSRDLSTAGLPSSRDTWPTRVAKPLRRAKAWAPRGRVRRQFRVPDLEMLGLAIEGATLVACARVEEGMRCLDEATATALRGVATVPISGAWACCFLVTACTAVRDYQRAFEWCDRIAEFAERYGSRYMLALLAPSTARCTCGGAGGRRRRRCSRRRSRTSADRDRRWSGDLWWAWRS